MLKNLQDMQQKLLNVMLFDDSESSDNETTLHINERQHTTKKSNPIDVYSALKGTPMFQEQLGVPEIIFSYILINMRTKIQVPRNIHFDYSKEENELRVLKKKKNVV